MGLHPQEIVDLVTLTEKFLDEKVQVNQIPNLFWWMSIRIGNFFDNLEAYKDWFWVEIGVVCCFKHRSTHIIFLSHIIW